MKKLVVLPLFALLLFACLEPPFKGVCQENGIRRACKSEEQAMIDAINKMIEKVKTFDPVSLHSDFFQVKNADDPELMIFGENHLATLGKIETLGAINSLAKAGDIILLEGADRRERLNFSHCGRYLLYRIFVNWQYEQTHGGYDPEELASFIAKQNFANIYKVTESSYDLSGMGIEYLQCYFWDHEESLLEEKITPANMKRRNTSMVEAIKDKVKNGYRVFVNTGYGHMPLGENIEKNMGKIYAKYEEHAIDMKDFYTKAKKERRLPRIKRREILSNYAASSKVLHNFLETMPHAQFIHRRMLIRPYEI